VGAAIGARGLEGSSVDWESFVVTAMGFGAAGGGRLSSDGGDTGTGAGVSSTVECLPVVHGGMERNSSKVRTRGLQHFQPVRVKSEYVLYRKVVDHIPSCWHSGMKGEFSRCLRPPE
jgi:hypothetical protein